MLTLDSLLRLLSPLLSPLTASLTALLLMTLYVLPILPRSTASTLLYYNNIYMILVHLHFLCTTFLHNLADIQALERDGLMALWLRIRRPKVSQRKTRVVRWGEEVVVITGGAGGLGREIVRGLVERGCGGVAVVDVVGEKEEEEGDVIEEVDGERERREKEKEEREKKEWWRVIKVVNSSSAGEAKVKTKVKRFVCDVGDAKAVEELKARVERDVCNSCSPLQSRT